MEVKQKLLRCGSATDANKLACSIHSVYLEDPTVPIAIRVVGAGSLNQAMKACIISNKFFSRRGMVVSVQPSFQDGNEQITAIELKVLLHKV